MYVLSTLLLKTTLQDKYCHPHFTDEKTEVQKVEVTCLRSHGQSLSSLCMSLFSGFSMMNAFGFYNQNRHAQGF